MSDTSTTINNDNLCLLQSQTNSYKVRSKPTTSCHTGQQCYRTAQSIMYIQTQQHVQHGYNKTLTYKHQNYLNDTI